MGCSVVLPGQHRIVVSIEPAHSLTRHEFMIANDAQKQEETLTLMCTADLDVPARCRSGGRICRPVLTVLNFHLQLQHRVSVRVQSTATALKSLSNRLN